MIEFSKLERKEDIVGALNSFDIVFPHLKEKIESVDSLAEKYCGNAEVFLLKDGDEKIGFIAFYDNDTDTKIGYISLIGVLPQYKRHGFGKKIVDFCICKCRSAGMASVKLEVDVDNVNAQDFYKYMGFIKTDDKSAETFYMEKKI